METLVLFVIGSYHNGLDTYVLHGVAFTLGKASAPFVPFVQIIFRQSISETTMRIVVFDPQILAGGLHGELEMVPTQLLG